MNSEAIFIDKIDCNFPYEKKDECLSLIKEASKLTPNAMFAVIEELCRIPNSERDQISSKELNELLSIASSSFHHPIKEMIVEVAQKMIDGQEILVENAISKMRNVQKYPGHFSALSILYSSCDDKKGELEPVWKEIREEWNQIITKSETLHEVWEDNEGLTMLCFSDERGDKARGMEEGKSKLIHTFYATNHFEAMQIYYN